MVGYFTAVAKFTSTAVLVCSVYLLSRHRVKRRRMDSSGDIPHESDNQAFASTMECPYVAETFRYPSDHSTNPTAASSLLAHGQSYLRHGWHFVSGFFHSARRTSEPPDAVKRILSSFTIEDMTRYCSLASELAKEANINPAIRGLLQTGQRKRLRRTEPSLESMFNSFLTALSSFTKDDLFLTLLLSNQDFCALLERIAIAFVEAFPPEVARSPEPLASPQQCRSNQESSDSFLVQVSISNEADSVDWPGPSTPQWSDDHPEYHYHLRLAQLLANISRHPQCQLLLRGSAIQRLLSLWSVSPSLHLTLLGQKISENLRTHVLQLTEPTSSTVIYFPDVFRLDRPDPVSDESNFDLDIIFIHGMRGSVYYTWRQKDLEVDGREIETSTSTKCWPRDWLSQDFPNARILAIDASLNPFVWDPICPVDKIERAIDTRAKKILPQLKAAGVGKRPIVWVTHSAGGILVKELLRMSCVPCVTKSPGPPNVGSLPTTSRSAIFSPLPDELLVQGDASPRISWFCDSEDESLKPTDNPPDPKPESPSTSTYVPSHGSEQIETSSDLTQRTAGVVFMSAPHRGNQSLFGLYRRPLRWTLTPEAIQLERNSSFLLDLHDWFHGWASRQHLPILSLVETRHTPVNRFWSVLLVPEDEKDREMGRVVQIDSDHMYISKPRNPSDPSYTTIVQFIRQIIPGSDDPVTA